MITQYRGRVWLFGDDINTDLIQPSPVVLLPIEEQVPHVFEANRPGWVELVVPGDLIVAGRNFGTGSSRPAAKVLRQLGLGGVIAESINGLFFRNCVNLGLPAIECPGAPAAFTEGDQAGFDLASGEVANVTRGTRLAGRPWAPELREILAAGGLIEQLEADGPLLTNTTRQ